MFNLLQHAQIANISNSVQTSMMLSSSAHNVIKVGEDGVTEFW
jgi:hypothetical protein